jgi:hypothetical protein
MFGSGFSATIDKLGLVMVRVKEERKAVLVELRYDFTPELAASIGGAAPAIQQMLGRSKDETSHLSGAGLHLDAASVEVTIAASSEEAIVLTTGNLTSRAYPSQAQGGSSPSLKVKCSFSCVDDEEAAGVWSLCYAHLGETVSVRMERDQLKLPLEGEAAPGVKRRKRAEA